MANKYNTEIRAYGMRVLLSRHPEVRRLKRDNIPSSHGNKFWTSSWGLIDYFKRRGMKQGSRIMEVGCGWGLAGIYCAKKHGAVVTGVDIDPDVFPFLKLHAEVNKVEIAFMRKDFNGLTGRLLTNTDILMGADICFWDGMVDQLRLLIRRAFRAGVKLVLIADPVRSPFEELCDYFVEKMDAEIPDWSIKRPRHIQGQILKITSPT
ncbi:MAG: methyltransferase domain-containing protein [Deltaproteobacteria bacterium]|nr:methyltransferase domain-containing protein [Deltaproteobacteria bacterium]